MRNSTILDESGWDISSELDLDGGIKTLYGVLRYLVNKNTEYKIIAEGVLLDLNETREKLQRYNNQFLTYDIEIIGFCNQYNEPSEGIVHDDIKKMMASDKDFVGIVVIGALIPSTQMPAEQSGLSLFTKKDIKSLINLSPDIASDITRSLGAKKPITADELDFFCSYFLH